MVIAGDCDFSVTARSSDVGEVLIGTVAGVREEASQGTLGGAPDLVDEGGQRAGIVWVRGHGDGDGHPRNLSTRAAALCP
jgi:hypothetical protein